MEPPQPRRTCLRQPARDRPQVGALSTADGGLLQREIDDTISRSEPGGGADQFERDRLARRQGRDGSPLPGVKQTPPTARSSRPSTPSSRVLRAPVAQRVVLTYAEGEGTTWTEAATGAADPEAFGERVRRKDKRQAAWPRSPTTLAAFSSWAWRRTKECPGGCSTSTSTTAVFGGEWAGGAAGHLQRPTTSRGRGAGRRGPVDTAPSPVRPRPRFKPAAAPPLEPSRGTGRTGPADSGLAARHHLVPRALSARRRPHPSPGIKASSHIRRGRGLRGRRLPHRVPQGLRG